MTHAQLVVRAGKWLESIGCGVVLTEPYGLQEIPDAFGYTYEGRRTYLVECKTSLSDFHAEKDKRCRQAGKAGLGVYRYYMSIPGLIDIDRLPPRWGLLHVYEKQVKVVHGYNPRMKLDKAMWRNTPNQQDEHTLLYYAALKMQRESKESK